MKKLITLVLTLIFVLAFTGCSTNVGYDISIVIPAGSQEEFVYSEEEVSSNKNQITISSGEGLGDTEVILKPVDVKEENAYESTYLTHGVSVKMDVEKGAWFKIGVSVQNPTDEDMIVYINVKDVVVRVE